MLELGIWRFRVRALFATHAIIASPSALIDSDS